MGIIALCPPEDRPTFHEVQRNNRRLITLCIQIWALPEDLWVTEAFETREMAKSATFQAETTLPRSDARKPGQRRGIILCGEEYDASSLVPFSSEEPVFLAFNSTHRFCGRALFVYNWRATAELPLTQFSRHFEGE